MENSKKPKVLFIMHMPPPVHGAAMMGKYIHDSKLINESFECLYINPSISTSVSSVGKVDLKKIGRLLNLYWKVFITVLRVKPDLCYYTATPGGKWNKIHNAILVAMLKLFRRKIILHLHNKGIKNFQGSKFADFLYNIILRNVKVILLSERLYYDVSQFVKHEDVYICPNGIPYISDKIQFQKNLDRDGNNLLFLSNLIPSKGVFVLLDALKIVKEQGYRFTCNFVGAETKKITSEIFEAEVENRGLSDCVFYLGKKYGDDKEAIFQQSDIFVFPTFYPGETFGLVLLEAMQNKLPCIATNVGGVPDVVEDGVTGFLVPPQDPVALSRRIIQLLIDKDLRKTFGENGFKLYNEKFTERRFEQRICEILQDCVS